MKLKPHRGFEVWQWQEVRQGRVLTMAGGDELTGGSSDGRMK
jgi:hypothetical protein